MVESVVAIAGVASAIIWLLSHMKTGKQAWTKAGERLGLTFDQGSTIRDPSLEGRIDGRWVEVRQRQPRRGVSRSYGVEMELELNHRRWSSIILRPHSSSARGRGQETGDPRFDAVFQVVGEVDEAFKRGLDQGGARRLLYQIQSEVGEFKIMHGRLLCESQGLLKEVEAIHDHVAQAVAWAEGLDRAMGVSESLST